MALTERKNGEIMYRIYMGIGVVSFFLIACGENRSDSGTDRGDASVHNSNEPPEMGPDENEPTDTPPRDCEGMICNSPDENRCNPDEPSLLLLYETNGNCSEGECIYPFDEYSCSGGDCENGHCPDLCEGKICTGREYDCHEDGRTLYVMETQGCDDKGKCGTNVREYDCGESECVNGKCEDDPCFQFRCQEPYANYCLDENTARTHDPNGTCTATPEGERSCNYDHRDVPCEQGCHEGACNENQCIDVFCDTPPTRYCDEDYLVVYDAHGRCEKGVCRYSKQRIACEEGCDGVSCIGQRCLGITCDNPPSNSCIDDKTLRYYPSGGVCSEGVCRYEEQRETCKKGCKDGRCLENKCVGKACLPPSVFCDGDFRTEFAVDPENPCKDGECQYVVKTTECRNGCEAGECKEEPCLGVTCETPPDDYCYDRVDSNDEQAAARYSRAGECVVSEDGNGYCEYPRTMESCMGVCVDNGVCRENTDSDSETASASDSDSGTETYETDSLDIPGTDNKPGTPTDTVEIETVDTEPVSTESGSETEANRCDKFKVLIEGAGLDQSEDQSYEMKYSSARKVTALCQSGDKAHEVTRQTEWKTSSKKVATFSDEPGQEMLVAHEDAGFTQATATYTTQSGEVKEVSFGLLVIPDGITFLKDDDTSYLGTLGEDLPISVWCIYDDERNDTRQCDIPVSWQTDKPDVIEVEAQTPGTHILLGTKLIDTAQVIAAVGSLKPAVATVTIREPSIGTDTETDAYREADTYTDSDTGTDSATGTDSDTIYRDRDAGEPDAGEPDAGGTDSDTEDSDSASDSAMISCGQITIRQINGQVTKTATVSINDDLDLEAVCDDENETNVTDKVDWNVSNTSIASIYDNGDHVSVTGVEEGQTTVIFESKYFKLNMGSLPIRVYAEVVEVIIGQDGEAPLFVGQSDTLFATCKLENGKVTDCETLDWYLDNETPKGVLQISSDTVTTTVTAKRTGNGNGVSIARIWARSEGVDSEYPLEITIIQPSDVRISPIEASYIRINETLPFSAKCDADDVFFDIDCTQAVDWQSENPEVAQISEDGIATGVSNGTAHIFGDIEGVIYGPSELNVGSSESIVFDDDNLTSAVREALKKKPGEKLSESDLEEVTSIDLAGGDISDLSGLERMPNLTTLYLSNNSLDDISALSDLNNLTYLDLGSTGVNESTALAQLASLPNLSTLYLNSNNIVDVSPLSNLSGLSYLYLYDNEIYDISALVNNDTFYTSYLAISNNLLDCTDAMILEQISDLVLRDIDVYSGCD